MTFGRYVSAFQSSTVCTARTIAIFFLLSFLTGSLAWAQEQNHAQANSVVRVSVTPELTKYWQVHAAGLREELSGTTGYLEVENVTNTTLHGGVLYAEYFDEEGRLCFTLTFSQKRNVGDGAMAASHERQTLYSAGSGMAPATRPTDTRIYLLEQGEGEIGKRPSQIDTVSTRAPVTVSGNVASDITNLRLTSELSSAKGPVLDLVLAKLTIDDRGAVRETRIINAVTPALRAWFLAFVRQLSFYPATNAGTSISSEVLLSVKAILSKEGVAYSLGPQYLTAPMKEYVKEIGGTEIPPVTQVIFGPPATKFKPKDASEYIDLPPAPPGTFQLMMFGSEWSNPHYDWIRDESMPWHLARRLAQKSSL